MCGRQAVYLGRSYFFEFSRYLPECMLSVIFHCLEGASHFRTKAQGFPAYRCQVFESFNILVRQRPAHSSVTAVLH